MGETVSLRECLIDLNIVEDAPELRLTRAFADVLLAALLGHDPDLESFLEGSADEVERRHRTFFYATTKYLEIFSLRDIHAVMAFLELIHADFERRIRELTSR